MIIDTVDYHKQLALKNRVNSGNTRVKDLLAKHGVRVLNLGGSK